MFSPFFRPVTNRHKSENVTENVTQSFNSQMVRFKVFVGVIEGVNVLVFQFQNGTI